jgi:peptide/nickel transport system permease protein
MPGTSVWPGELIAPVANRPRARRWSLARLRRIDPILAFGLVLTTSLAAAAVLAPWLAPYDPDAQRLLARLRPPVGFPDADPRHLLGADQLGRDLLSRSLFGLRLSLVIALLGAGAGLLLGAAVGFLASLAGGRTDSLLMGLVDVKLSLPVALVALFVIALAGRHLAVLVLVLALAYWAHVARLVRAQVLALRELPYVEAARAAGTTEWRIAVRHLLPNIVSPLVVMVTLNISNLMLLESALSFLGLGVQPPTATLGSMVGQGRDYLASAPWIAIVPAVLIVLVSLAVMLLGDGLRDRLDVRLREH